MILLHHRPWTRWFHLGLGTALCTALTMVSPAPIASAEDLDLEELYRLCSGFPHNSRCEGFDIPVILDNQPGTLVGCGFELNERPSSSSCRILLEEEALTVFIEVGDKVEFLDDERGSEAIAIPLDHIFTSDLRIWARGTDAASFFVRGNLYVLKDEDYEGFERDYDPTDDDERGGFGDRDFAELEIGFVSQDPTELGNRSDILRITASEEYGAYLFDTLAPLLPEVGNNPLLSELTLIPEDEVDPDLQAEQIAQLQNDDICIRCDLRWADLSELDLDDANLEGSYLAGANLTEAELEDVYLVGANLDGADLTDADLSGGRLTLASLENSDLTRADLNVVNFQQANLTAAILTEVTLAGGNLDYATLTNADLSGADLTNFTAVGFIPFLGWDRFKLYTTLRYVNATSTSFHQADLDNTRLDDAILSGANLTEADVDDTDFTGATLVDAIASGVDLTVAKLCNTTLPDGTVSNEDCKPEEEEAESEDK